jgi:ferredoxin
MGKKIIHIVIIHHYWVSVTCLTLFLLCGTKSGMIKIYYFSGTGNTYWSAKKLAEQLESAKIYSISREIRQSEIRIEADVVVFLFPSYAYETPLMVRRFLEKADIHANYIAAAVSYGSSPGGSLAEVSRVLRRKKLTLDYAGRIPAVENYIPIFGVQGPEKQNKRLAMQREATFAVAEAIRNRSVKKVQTFRPVSKAISTLFRLARPVFPKGFRRTKECTVCGLCEKLCPAGAISMTAAGPVFQKSCEHCQACLNFCPRRAISFARMKPDTPRYHHPEVSAKELFS